MVETRKEAVGFIVLERVQIPGPARPNARTLRRGKRFTEEKEVNMRVALLSRHASMQVNTKRGNPRVVCVAFVFKQVSISLFFFPVSRCRGHSALQPTTVPHSQQPPRPKLLQLHVLQGLGGQAERRRRPQEPCRHGPHHHGGLPTRRWGAGGTEHY